MAGAPATTAAAVVPSLPALRDGGVGGRGCWEDGAISLGLVAVQLAGAAYMVVVTPVLALGLDPLFLVAFGSLTTGLLTLPFALKVERKKWPSELNNRLLLQFVLLALGGVTGFQALMLHGMNMTSPAIASAMPNLAPGFIFVISGCLGFERVDLKCRYTKAKILGTVLCLGGAVAMSVLQSPAVPPGHALHRSMDRAAVARPHRDWVVGCLCLLGAVLVLSGTIVLQAVTMLHFPSPFTLCSVTSLIGAVLTAAFQVVTTGRLSLGTPQISLEIVLSLVLVGGLVSSACITFQTWALEKKGPVMVSMFSPTQTVGSAIFSTIFLGRVMQTGSMLGMVFLFSGLYVVLWAKKKEGQVLAADRMATDQQDNDDDMEKPLLFRD
ncbi:WAT1-related protein At5g47470-like [Phragmites australis]|uniref:WAT1-related protein At5g47470-like n=1 Tax=Phragmites australis TaxID=29695 RepID=UPI002D772D06|nr:WAT1-related protein At5g47470-like [Phragmites australis]